MYWESGPKPVIRKLAAQFGVHHEALWNGIHQNEADRGDRPTSDLAAARGRVRARRSR